MDDLNQVREKVLHESAAQTAYKMLEGVDNNRTEYVKRWIWELLQNARDAAKEHPATIRVTIDDHNFTFQHDGAPFNPEEITHLIYCGSSKDEPATETIGRFGSGFLTTHVLAKSINITGLIKTDSTQPPERFQFTLHRDGTNAHELSQAMEQSWNAFTASRTNNQEHKTTTTTYEYPLTPDTTTLATDGIATLKQLAPYALAFNPSISALHITQYGRTQRTWVPKDENPTTLAPGITSIPIRTQQDNTTREQPIITATNGNVTIAVSAETRDGRTTITLPTNCPRLFIAFPLFGTENFCFPAIINSEGFNPQEDRDSLFLANDDKPLINQNKALITAACKLYQNLITLAGTQAWQGLHHLALLPFPDKFNWLDQDWYNNLLREQIITPARNAPIVQTTNGERQAPKNTRIPLAPSQTYATQLWELSTALTSISETLPDQAEREGWATVITRWASILGQDANDLPEAWTITKLATHIANRGSLQALQTDLGSNDAIAWLHNLYELITTSQHTNLFDLALLPDQNGNLRTRSTLQTDAGIDEALKDIAATLGVPARDILLDARISHENIPKLLPKTDDELAGQLLQVITTRQTTDAGTPTYRDANTQLFTWLLTTGQTEKLDGYPVYTEQQDNDGQPFIIRLARSHADHKQIPLAPHVLWPESAQPFVDLFAERHRISTTYYGAHPDHSDWHALARQRYVRCDPVYEFTARENELLNAEAPPDGDNHATNEDVTTTNIAFFATDNTGVIDRTRGSQTRARQLLHFLAGYASTKAGALDHVTIACTCGQQHKYYRATWLRPLRGRKWVPIGDKQAVPPNVDVIANLLHDEPAFLRALATGPAAPMMTALGISGTDLLLRIGTTTEAERVELVATALDLSNAVGNDATKLAAITKALQDNPDAALKDIQEGAARRNKVQRNQGVGKIVEDTLRALLEGSGLTVTRKHIGHDFEIEYDTDIIDTTTGEEQFWEITRGRNSFLLEVKASTEAHYRMTPKQAETAVSTGPRFVLCMVNLTKATDITPEDVLTGARFVPTISQALNGLYHELTQLKSMTEAVPKTDGDIELEIQDAQVRFTIGKKHWEQGLPFNDAITFFQQRNHDDKTP